MNMELFPSLQLGWMNGWILLCVWFAIQGLSILAVSREVRDRLFEFDRSSWSKKQRGSFLVGKSLGLAFLIIAVFTRINFSSLEFSLGLVIFTLGLVGLVVALHNFQKTPLDNPVAIGLYKYSRHPQLVMLLVIGIGLSFALSSWFLLLIRVIAFGFEHPGVVAEEDECIRRFGESYQEYLNRVPRYLFA